MQEFKKIVKMKCGGSVTKAVEMCGGGRMKEGGKVKHGDTAEDKKLIKKAFNLHDDQKHEGKTDLSKLKKGGRCKKDGGTVRKYKDGGNVKKMADGGMTGQMAAINQAVGVPASPAQNVASADLVKRKLLAQQAAKARGVVPPPAAAAAGAPPAGGLAQAPSAPMGQQAPVAPMKRGGKAKGCK
jgi:hypothetical protein